MQYIQIKEAIAEQINSGMLSPRQKLPAERQLAQSFATTRVTLREALTLLEAEGIIYREDRRGWFISPSPFIYKPNQGISFTQSAKNQHRKPQIKVIKAQNVLANKQATQLLSLPPFSNIYWVDRLYLLDDAPVAYVRHYILPQQLDTLIKQDLTCCLLELYQKNYGIQYQRATHRIYVRSVDSEIAEALRVTTGASSIVVEKQHYRENQTVIDCSLEYWRHNAISIEIT